jgi:hypothetical protein
MLVFITGLAVMLIGVAIVVKTEAFLSAFGRIGFFERFFGTEGGSRLGYKLIGLAAVFIGFLMVTGLINAFMSWLLGPIMRYQI